MKRALVILMIVVVGALFGIMFMVGNAPPHWSPNTQITFLGFTNLIAGTPATNALFGIKNVPKESTEWRTREINHKEGTNWKAWEPFPHFNIFAVIPVETTNVPSRIVIELIQAPTGKVELLLRGLRVQWAKFTHQDVQCAWNGNGPTFCITNEINARGGTIPASP